MSRSRTTLVVTYRLIYQPGHEVELCAECADSETHEQGALGEVTHGAHRGYCEGARHYQITGATP